MFDFFKNKNIVKLVYDDDLVSYLKSIKFFDQIIAGKCMCRFCGKKITLENLDAIVPKGSDIKFVCSNYNCPNQI